jgi:shikimate dehydrogenase
VTRLLGVIGHPIAHSLSPVMHTAALRALGIDGLYTAFDVPPTFLRPVVRALTLAGVEGLNVTVPLKERVVALADRLDGAAQATGAVNTLVMRGGRIAGHNTDVEGFRRGLLEDTGAGLRGKRVLLLGAGGAARAAAWALAGMGVRAVWVMNRTRSRAHTLARWLVRAAAGERLGLGAAALPYPAGRHAPDVLEQVDAVINATSLGLRADDPAPIRLDGLRRGAVVYDLIYHRDTALVREARRRGAVAATGASMLLYQGAESLRLWLHRAPPVDVMRRALQQALRGRRPA